VTCFGSAIDAFEVVKHTPPQCLVLDLRMPKLDGLSFVQRLHALGIAVPTVLISGNFDPATHAQAADLGVTQLLVKPFSTSLLQEAIRAVVVPPPST